MTPKSNNLIIFDLDETLIHSTTVELSDPFHFKFDAYFVYERPLLRTFLHDIAQHFQIGIWSSAGDEYVQEIVSKIMPETVEPVIVWARSKCSLRRNILYDTYEYEKRLDKLRKKGFRLEQILIVDDSPEKARTNYGNAIFIKEFTGNRDDRELHFLFNYLLTLKMVENVRTIEKRGWRDGYAAMLGLNVANTFNIGYSYDFTKTDLRTYSKGTHELMIGFLIGNGYGDTCPRNVW